MRVRVELFGIPRHRIGVPYVMVCLDSETARLCDVLWDVARQFPSFAEECMVEDRVQVGISVNLDGNQFVNDPETVISAGQSLLIMSADAGG